jgi:O-antigen/teichoic acid export membrane protein
VLAALVVVVPVLYGSGFRGSVSLGFILIPGVSALGLAKVLSAISSGRGFPRYGLYCGAITVPITLALYVVLIPKFHATGAAVASTCSYVIATVITAVFFRRATSIPMRALVPSRSDLVDYADALRFARARLRTG